MNGYDVFAWGHDHDNYSIDGADVGYFTGHGSHKCNSTEGWYWSWMHLGNTSYECTPDSDDSSGNGADWYYEDSMAVLIIDACRNMQKCVWQNGGYAQAHDPDTDMFAGYHGSAFDDEDQVQPLEDYVDSSRYSGLGENWLAERVVWESGDNTDQCPTVAVFGSSSTLRHNLFYNGGLDDHLDTGSHTGGSYFYLSGCDPINGPEL